MQKCSYSALPFVKYYVYLYKFPSLGVIFDDNRRPMMRCLLLLLASLALAVPASASPGYWYATDAFGYVATNDHTPNWRSPLLLQNSQTWSLSDDAVRSIGIGALHNGLAQFQGIRYYNDSLLSLNVGQNGLLLAAGNHSDTFFNGYLPNPNDAFPAVIAPFWDDLIGGQVHLGSTGSTLSDPIVIIWEDVAFYSEPSNVFTLQIELHPDGVIVFNYDLGTLPANARRRGSGATIGIENTVGDVGIQYAYNNRQALPETGYYSIAFYPPGHPNAPAPLSVTNTPTPLPSVTPTPNTAPAATDVAIVRADTSAFPEIFLDISVLDASANSYVSGLPSSSFQITETIGGLTDTPPTDGAIQGGLDAPLALSLVLDRSGSMGRDLPKLRESAIDLANWSNCTDSYSVFAFDTDVDKLLDFTMDRGAIEQAIKPIRDGGATALFEAICDSLNDTWPVDSRRAIIAFTDGEDNASNYPCSALAHLQNLANSKGIQIYTISFHTASSPSYLIALSTATGGFHTDIQSMSDLLPAYQSIVDQVRQSYTVSYTSNLSATNDLRTVTVDIANSFATSTIDIASGHDSCTLDKNTAGRNGIFTLGAGDLLAQEIRNHRSSTAGGFREVSIRFDHDQATLVEAEIWSYDAQTGLPGQLEATSSPVEITCEGWYSFEFPAIVNLAPSVSSADAKFLVLRHAGLATALVSKAEPAGDAPGGVSDGGLTALGGASWNGVNANQNLLFRVKSCGGFITAPATATPLPPTATPTPSGPTPTPTNTPGCTAVISGIAVIVTCTPTPGPATATPTPTPTCGTMVSGVMVTCTPTPQPAAAFIITSSPIDGETGVPLNQDITIEIQDPNGMYNMLSPRVSINGDSTLQTTITQVQNPGQRGITYLFTIEASQNPYKSACQTLDVVVCCGVDSQGFLMTDHAFSFTYECQATTTPTPTTTPQPTATPTVPFQARAQITLTTNQSGSSTRGGGPIHTVSLAVSNQQARPQSSLWMLLEVNGQFWFLGNGGATLTEAAIPLVAGKDLGPTFPAMEVPSAEILSVRMDVPVTVETVFGSWHAAFVADTTGDLTSNISTAPIIVMP